MTEFKRAHAEDLPMVAACHVAAFPDTMSAKLGVEFVTKTLECYVHDDNKFLLFLDSQGECAGYVSGIFVDENSGLGSASSMLQSSWGAGLRALLRKPQLLLDPELREKVPFVVRNLKHRLFGKRGSNHAGAPKRPAGYRSVGIPGICVHPGHRRKGYASKLMLAAEAVGYDAGYRHMHSTVAVDNVASADCHLKLGYRIAKRDAKTLKMEKSLD